MIFHHIEQVFVNISQPALSKSIHNLENELGVKLFDRIGNRIHLNQLEKHYLPRVCRRNFGLYFGVYETKPLCSRLFVLIQIRRYSSGRGGRLFTVLPRRVAEHLG